MYDKKGEKEQRNRKMKVEWNVYRGFSYFCNDSIHVHSSYNSLDVSRTLKHFTVVLGLCCEAE